MQSKAGVVSFNTRAGAVTLSAADVTTVLPPSAATPAMDGAAAPGTATTWARGDHVHPTDTSRYAASNPSGYQTAAQVAAATAPYANDVGRNLLHNPLFNVAQRGAGPFTAFGMTADRWGIFPNGGDTMSATVIAVADTGRAQIGDEACSNAFQIGVVGSSNVGAFSLIYQKIEGVRRLAGKSVTVSFWARCTVAANIGVSWHQFFGTGGSPSAEISGPGQAVAVIAGSYAYYSVTLALPSIAGMTLGTNGDDSTPIYIWLSAQAAQNTASGVFGVQAGTFAFWGMLLVVGGAATPLEKPDPQQDLAKCQRFYTTLAAQVPAAANAYTLVLPTTMRAAPATISGGGAGFATTNLSAASVTVSQTATAAQTLTFSAEL